MTTDTGQELVLRPGTGIAAPVVTDAEMNRLWRLAQQLFQSGMFPNVKKAEQAYAKILLGRDLGLSPTQSMTAINLIDGRPELSSVTLAYFIRVRRDYNYKILTPEDKLEEECEIEFTVGDEVRGTSKFTTEDAQTAGLLDKTNWKKYRKDMLFWRAMSRGVKRFVPEVIGGVPVYYEGEISRESDYVIGPNDVGEIEEAIILPRAVEQVIERATALGHVGYADRGTAEMVISGQEESFVRQWVEQANEELDGMERVSSTEVDAPADSDVSPDAIRARANDLLDQASQLSDENAESNRERIGELEAEAMKLMATVAKLEDE